MSDDETPFTPMSSADTSSARPEEPDASTSDGAGGKVISADVFLSRLAERQMERDTIGGEVEMIDAILGALESMGLDPSKVAPEFIKMARTGSPLEDEVPAADAHQPSLEDMAVERLFLSELRAGKRPSLNAYMRRYAAQRDALLRLAARMDPRELAGLPAPEKWTPEQEAAARAGQEEGVRKALLETRREASEQTQRGSSRKRGAARKLVAEERASYGAGQPEGGSEEKPRRDRQRAQPVLPEEKNPEG